MTKVNVRIAPREPAICAMVKGRIMLLDAPRNSGFKAWVEGDTKMWEHGDTREQAKLQMERRLKAEGLKLDEVIQQNEGVR